MADPTVPDPAVPDPTVPHPDHDDASTRADLLPEERVVGSDDPQAQAAAILEESRIRTEVPGAAPDTVTEHRRSDETL